MKFTRKRGPSSAAMPRHRRIGGLIVLILTALWVAAHWNEIDRPAEFGDKAFWGLFAVAGVVTPVRVVAVLVCSYVISSIVIRMLEGQPLKKVGQAEAETEATGRGIEATSKGALELDRRVSDLEEATQSLVEVGKGLEEVAQGRAELDRRLGHLEAAVSGAQELNTEVAEDAPKTGAGLEEVDARLREVSRAVRSMEKAMESLDRRHAQTERELGQLARIVRLDPRPHPSGQRPSSDDGGEQPRR